MKQAWLFAFLLAACSPAPSPPAAGHQESVAALPAECVAPEDAGFAAQDCRVAHGADNYMVHFKAEPDGATGGEVTVEAGSQRLRETNVSEYFPPTIEDVDGDGADDILIARETGNANANYAFWRNVNGHYVRLGELDGVQFAHTADGYIAAPARSSAAEWEVPFYRVDPTALTPLLTLDVTADADDQGHVTGFACEIESAPGLASLHMTRAAAQAKFCAEPAAKVFE